jgi:hypothetical protein
MLPTELPDNWLCYTPFLTVFVHDSSWRRLGPTQRRALEQWVQAGGRLVIYGGSDQERLEPRMLGTIEYVSFHPLKNTSQDRKWASGEPAWLQFARTGQGAAQGNPYVIRKLTGGVWGLSLATIFFVVAGPLNYWYFARRNRIRTLLVSLPLASVACCLLITGFFLVTQGFAKRGGSVALIVLDEQTDSAITFSRHVFFSGLYPLGGFTFDREAAFCPLGSAYRGASCLMDLTGDQHLQSGLFAPSTNFHYTTVRPWTTRAKLVWDLDDMTVLNGFDAAAERIVLRVGDKAYEANGVGRGGKAKLVELPALSSDPGALAEAALGRSEPAQEFLLRHMDGIVRTVGRGQSEPDEEDHRATYMIVFSSPPVELDAGLTMSGGNACCALVGKSVLQAETER